MKPFQSLILCTLLFCLATTSQAAVDWKSNQVMPPKSAILDMAPTFDGKKLFILTKGTLTLFDTKGKKIGSTPVNPGMDSLSVTGFQPAGIPEKIFVTNSTTGQIDELTFSLVVPIDDTGSPFLGNAEAPVVVAIFSDFQ